MLWKFRCFRPRSFTFCVFSTKIVYFLCFFDQDCLLFLFFRPRLFTVCVFSTKIVYCLCFLSSFQFLQRLLFIFLEEWSEAPYFRNPVCLPRVHGSVACKLPQSRACILKFPPVLFYLVPLLPRYVFSFTCWFETHSRCLWFLFNPFLSCGETHVVAALSHLPVVSTPSTHGSHHFFSQRFPCVIWSMWNTFHLQRLAAFAKRPEIVSIDFFQANSYSFALPFWTSLGELRTYFLHLFYLLRLVVGIRRLISKTQHIVKINLKTVNVSCTWTSTHF